MRSRRKKKVKREREGGGEQGNEEGKMRRRNRTVNNRNLNRKLEISTALTMRNRGNQLIHKRLSKTKSIGSG